MKKTILLYLILAFVILLSACTNTDTQEPITFPAYQYEDTEENKYHEVINNTPSFNVDVDFPETWTLKETMGEGNLPVSDFYTKRFIYDGETLVGYIGFNVFEPYQDEIPQEDYYKTVYPSLRLPSMCIWDPYEAVKTSETGETGITNISYKDPDEIENYAGKMPTMPTFETLGILSYDKDLKVFIGIAFSPDTVDRTLVETIAQSISLTESK